MKMGRQTLYNIVAFCTISIAVIVPQWYLYITRVALGWGAFFWALMFPTILAVVIFAFGRRWIQLFAFLALIWPLTEDAPVYLDSIFTWPEVTSGFQHLFLEVLFHLLTLFFLFLTIREALKGTEASRRKVALVSVLAFTAFVLSYAQNIPLDQIEDLVATNWYGLDIAEHTIALVFLFFAVYEARIERRQLASTAPSIADSESSGIDENRS